MVRSGALSRWVLAVAGSFLLAACSSGSADDAVDAQPSPEVPPPPEPVVVEFVKPGNGDTVASPVEIELGVTGLSGEHAPSAHLHIMIDIGCVTPGQVIPRNDQHVHLEPGATTAALELTPGQHDLCAQAGDSGEQALGTVDFVTVTVEG